MSEKKITRKVKEPDNSFTCCICGKECKGFGNNPDGAVWKDESGKIVFPKFKANDRCCDECNDNYVIVGRMYSFALKKKEEEKKGD